MVRWLPAVLVLCLLAIALPSNAQDADRDGLDDAQEQAIADANAPVLYFHPQEAYFPTSVQFAFGNSVLERYQSNGPPIRIDNSPTASGIAAFNVQADPATNPDGVYYLNNTKGTYLNDSAIRTTYAEGNYPRVVYVHVTTVGGDTVAQYWFYYAFNPGSWNNHEGDWEMIQVNLVGTNPTEVGYSQHESGERMAWADVSVEDTHPKVYVALGSHASYLRPFEGTFGISGDRVSGAGPVWRVGNYTLVNVGELTNPTPGNEWLKFAGRWGEFSLPYEGRGESGPPGPAYRQGGNIFGTPVDWAASLDVPNTTVLLLDWFLANLFTIFLILAALSVVLALVRAWRVQRRTHAGVKMWPYAHLRGMNRTTSALIVAVIGMVVGVAGFLLPWYVMTVDANAPGFLVTNGPRDLLRMDGVNGLTINPMRSDGRIVQVSILPVPLGLMLSITTALFFVRIVGTKTSKRLGARFIAKGIVTILPFVFVLLVMTLVLPALPADDPSQVGVDDFLRPISSSPFGGRTTQTLEGGTAILTWGLGLGAILMIASGVLMFIAGFLAISRVYSFIPRTPIREMEGPEPVPQPVPAGMAAEPMQAAGPEEASAVEPVYEPAADSPAEPVQAPEAQEPPWQQDAPTAPITVTPPEPVPMGPSCVNCGSPVEPDAKVCFYCGLPVV